MTSYPRSAYHNPFGNVQPNAASSRGWGSGWPNCQSGTQKTVSGGGVRVTVRHEIAELAGNLLSATNKLYRLDGNYTGGYNCRPIANTNTASNHSWGLAIDINYNQNPRTASTANFHSEIPPAVVAMWNDCGFFWGGFYNHSSDTMHFEFVGTPGSVAGYLAKAKQYNGATPPAPNPSPAPTPTPTPTPSPVLVVRASSIAQAATTNSTPAGMADMVKVVQQALVDEKLMAATYTDGNGNQQTLVDGHFGNHTKGAYKAWQTSLGYTGTNADGVPGFTSLSKLGSKHNFTVIK